MQDNCSPLSGPVPLQVVFQGGGAKLCLLMAVAEVLQQYEAAGLIEIRRLAGSSAGAVAAVMLASKKPIQIYKAELKRIAPAYLAKATTSSLLGALRVLWGNAYFNKLYLENFFNELFCGDGKLTSLNALPIKGTKVYYTELYSLASLSCSGEESIPKALGKSCRFPFAFVGFSSGDTQVDGGLALNLPVDELKNDESTLGSVIGISFLNKFGDVGKSNLLSYTQQLFSAAIQGGVARSENLLGSKNVYSINTDLGTFDFARAIDVGLGMEYSLVASRFDTWLSGWLKSSGPIDSVEPDHSHKLLRPDLSDTPWAPAVVREVNDRLAENPSTRALSIACFDTAVLDEKGEFTGKYTARSIKTFNVIRPTNVLQFDFQIGRGGSFAQANLGCAVLNSRGDALSFIPHVEELTKTGDVLRSFRVYFLFNQPLAADSPHQPYRVEYQYEGDNPYPNIGKGRDAAALIMRQGGAEQAILCVRFPRVLVRNESALDIAEASANQLQEAQYDLGDEKLVPSENLPLFDFVDSMMRGNQPVDRYVFVGRRARNLTQGQAFGFIIECLSA